MELEAPPAREGSMDVLCRLARQLDIPFADATPPASRFVPSNGIRMHVLDWGNPGKPDLVFLHGGSGTAHTWDLVCLALRDRYHCMAVDQRGHGETDGLFGFGVDEPRADIRGLAQGLGLNRDGRRFALVGMSLGGNNTIAYAGVHADTLAAAVFVDICPSVLPTAYKDVDGHSKAIAQTTDFEAAVDASHAHNPLGSKDYKRYLLSHSLRRFEDGHWHMRYEKKLAPRLPGAEYAAMMKARHDTLWSLVPRITCPALVVHGLESRSQNHDNMARFASTLPQGRLVELPAASHHVQEDQPRALAATIGEFLAAVKY